MKIVINNCYGGFSLSPEAERLYAKKLGIDVNDSYWSSLEINREDPVLVQVVEELGSRANGSCAELRIVEVPDGIKWCIQEYDGNEWVAEEHRTWG